MATSVEVRSEGTTRWGRVANGLLVVAAVVAVGGWIAWGLNTRDWSMLDLTIYRGAGNVVRSGEPLYSWKFEDWLPFTYTPFAALLFSGLRWFTAEGTKVGSTLIDGIALTVTIWAVLHSVRIGRAWQRIAAALVLGLGALALEPVEATISFGQVNAILMAMVVVDVLVGDGRRWQGIGIGLATAIKITPAIFIPYLLLTKRTASAVRAAATFAATILVSYVFIPDDTRTFWFDRVFLDASRTGNVGYVGNQSMNGALFRWFGSGSLVLLALVGVWGMAVAVVLHRRGRPQAGLLVVALTGLLASPVSWTHHWVWVVPAIVYVLVAPRWRLLSRLAAVSTLVLVFAAPGWLWSLPRDQASMLTADLSRRVASDLYVIAGVLVLAAVTLWLVIGDRRRGSPATDPVPDDESSAAIHAPGQRAPSAPVEESIASPAAGAVVTR